MRVRTYTKQQIEDAVKKSVSWAGVMKILNPSAEYKGSQSNIKKTAVKMGIEFPHFTGQAWNKGKTSVNKKPLEYYLGGGFIRSNELKKRLVREGLKKWICESCDNENWMGEKIPLELHHKDHNPTNNKLENLKLVCPNCHYKEHNSVREIKERRLIRQQKQKTQKCKVCGKPSKNIFCSTSCYHKNSIGKVGNRKAVRPKKEELIQMIQNSSFLQVGKSYGVSDNAIRKWCKSYGIDLKIFKR